MKNLLTIIFSVLQLNLFGQDTGQIKSYLDSIVSIVEVLPKTTHLSHDSKYEMTYSKNLKRIEITDLHFEKGSDKKKADHNVYTFDLSDLDPKFVIIKEFDTAEDFYIQLLTIDNKPKIKQESLVEGKVRNTFLQDRVTMGRWAKEHLKSGEKVRSLFISAITEMLGDQADIATSTNSGLLKMVIQTRDGKSQKIDIPEANREAEPKYLFGSTDLMPSFQGAKNRSETEKKLAQYFKEKINYDPPRGAGTVYVQFTIDKTGKPADISVVRGVNATLDKLAIDYISQMEKWTPGKHKGENVLVTYTTAVKF